MAYTDEPYTRVATAESKIMVTASFEKKKKEEGESHYRSSDTL